MRRASLFAPLLLIALGALFLARNLYPDLPLTDYVARYWPYILILWGVLRIAEILYWASSSKPIPAHGVSGGEWFLVVFLCLIGIGVHAAHYTARGWFERIPWASVQVIGERFDYPVNAEKAASKAPHIVIEDFRGDLQITGSDTDAVKVTGRKSVRAMDQDGAENADKNSGFEVTGDPGQITVRLHEGSGVSGRISSSLEVTVPKGASVEAKRRDGDLHISNVEGNVTVSGRAADLDVRDVGGAVSVEGTYTGDILLKNVAKSLRFKSQRTDFTTAGVPGEIHIDPSDFNADGLTGPVRLSSRSRDVHVQNFRNALEVDLERGDLDLQPGQVPLSRIQATVRSGDVRLALPESAAFSLKATTRNGDISNGLGAGFKVDSEGRRHTLQGSSGAGPEISLELERGDIFVTRGSPKTPARETAHPLETINQ
ncbi:MAG TPA: DUF4097 family beta strand repeat-containing protein [Bryobacteraceae bacterium]|nr:DUF4097 family beta strand repeat-containing protein [Bryobacteraceae bacterium]